MQKKKVLIYLSLFLSSLMLFSQMNIKNDLDANNNYNVITNIKTSWLNNSEPIILVGQSQTDSFPNKTGSGTELDPYIIQNQTVQADTVEIGEGNFLTTCLYISQLTTRWIEIRNCIFYDSFKHGDISGYASSIIGISSSSNIKIINCTMINASNCSWNSYVWNCDTIEFTDCLFDNENEGESFLFHTNQSTNILINNSILKNSYGGIGGANSSINFSSIIDSTIVNITDDYAIKIEDMYSVDIDNNIIYNVAFGVITGAGDEGINITNNRIFNITESHGIKISGATIVYNISNNIVYSTELDYRNDENPLLGNGIWVLGYDEQGIINNNTIYDCYSGIRIEVESDTIQVTNNDISNCYDGITLQSYNYNLNISRNIIDNVTYGIFSTGFNTDSNITWNYFWNCIIPYYSTEGSELANFSNNYYKSYYDLYPYDIPNDITLTNTTLNNIMNFSGVIDYYPQYNPTFYLEERQYFIQYYSNYDLLGFNFYLVKTFVDLIQVTHDVIDQENLIIRVTTKDFANVIMHDQLYNYNISRYILIGLNIADTEFINSGNELSWVFIKRQDVIMSFKVPPSSSKTLRFHDGIDYEIWVENENGTEVIEKHDIEIENGGFFNVTWSELEFEEEPPIILTLNIIDYLLGFSFLGVVAIVFYIGMRPRRNSRFIT